MKEARLMSIFYTPIKKLEGTISIIEVSLKIQKNNEFLIKPTIHIRKDGKELILKNPLIKINGTDVILEYHGDLNMGYYLEKMGVIKDMFNTENIINVVFFEGGTNYEYKEH